MPKPFAGDYFLISNVVASQATFLNHDSGEVEYDEVGEVHHTNQIFIYERKTHKEVGIIDNPTGDDTEDYEDIIMLIKEYEKGLNQQ